MPAGVHLKAQLNVRVSDESHALLHALQVHLGELTQAQALEVVIREAARARGIKTQETLASWSSARGRSCEPSDASK